MEILSDVSLTDEHDDGVCNLQVGSALATVLLHCCIVSAPMYGDQAHWMITNLVDACRCDGHLGKNLPVVAQQKTIPYPSVIQTFGSSE